MKQFFLLVFATFLFSSCDKEQGVNYNNPYLPNYQVNLQIDMTLPAYNNLNFAGNAVYEGNGVSGIRGVIIFNTGSGYTAFDAACPNQPLSSCSTMTIDGINAECACDGKQYSLFTGQSAGMQYQMKPYRVSQSGNVLYITN